MKLPFSFVWRFLRGQVCPFLVAEDLSSEVGVPFYTLTSSSQESWNFSLSGTIVGDNGLTLRHSRGCVVVIHGLHYSFLITKMLKIFLRVYLPSVPNVVRCSRFWPAFILGHSFSYWDRISLCIFFKSSVRFMSSKCFIIGQDLFIFIPLSYEEQKIKFFMKFTLIIFFLL